MRFLRDVNTTLDKDRGPVEFKWWVCTDAVWPPFAKMLKRREFKKGLNLVKRTNNQENKRLKITGMNLWGDEKGGFAPPL